MAQHTTEKPYKCEHCCRSFASHDWLLCHIARKMCTDRQVNVWRNKCYFCHKFFPQSAVLNAHLKSVHLREGFKRCGFCSKYFSNTNHVQTHIRSVHLEERKFKCGMCGRMYKSRPALNEHILVVHTMERTLRCYFCNKSYTAHNSAGHLTEHMRTHTGEKPFSCYFCNVQFTQNSALNMHLVTIHIRERPYRCSKCPDRSFPVRSKLNLHSQRIHNPLSNRTGQ
jgi:KRAB domain-containing zinc finger protein